ncbi:uncharacterized protein UHO2_01309 [Ustilago hordei]|uniref:5'-deoxynucleotidase n=1 Tax=Ustilago hordei TaxID=120017 RepID=I2G4S0_USTHO|nr:uncharacterized protein UHO2_01309 [Ustilago hordei]CCF54163.1 uncharacterized protein UHOR_00654 [Ustilago hordei]SYW74443.1 uncharacterized protein UHO2_01309 [Ustilago hordei]
MSSASAPAQADAFMSSGALTDNISGLSAALARESSSSSSSSSSIREWTCPCLNIRLSLAPGSAPSSSSTGNRSPWLAELSSNNAIQIQFPSLTSRETVSLAENTNIACAKCLNCDTVVYAASKPAPPAPARALGFNASPSNAANGATEALKEAGGPVSPTSTTQYRSPSRESASKADRNFSRSSEPLVRPLDRKVWMFPDALSPEQASNVAGSNAFSPAFNVLIPRGSAGPREEVSRDRSTEPAYDNIRDATPTRPSAGIGNRRSSYASNTSNLTYVLPPVPQHLITSPPSSPRVGAPPFYTSAAPLSPGITASPAPVSNTSSSNPIFPTNPLTSQLDSVAIERLKDMRSKAEAEVFELVRQKRREMELLEKRFREEAESLLAVTKAPKQNKSSATKGSTASLIEKALKEQHDQQQQSSAAQQAVSLASVRQNATTPTPQTTASATRGRPAGSAAPREIATAQSSVPSSGRRDSLHDEYSDLPPSAFERRPTYAPSTGNGNASKSNGGAQPNVASSLGGLSASFAMRGRELPTQMQDWAGKRRLRERYPEGDHSALPSAANSNATSAVNSIADSEEGVWLAQAGAAQGAQEGFRTRESSTNAEVEAEMDNRGRGRQPSRQRGGSSSRELREPRVAPTEQQKPQQQQQFAEPARSAQNEIREEGRRGRTGKFSIFNPASALSSSLLTKRPALAYIDDGRDADENTPSVGGKLISPHSVAEPSAQVTLRPRDPPPSNAEPLKPATRSTAASGENSKSSGCGRSSAAPSDPSTSGKGRGQDSPSSRKADKKVAFAETEDRVDHNVASDEYDEDGEDDDVDASAQRMNDGPRSTRISGANLVLVDEAADAVFEIDEETEDADAEEDGNADESQASPEDHDRHKVEMSQSGLRTGASGRPRGQADDTLPGFEDEATEHSTNRCGPSSGSLSDDFRSSSSDDEDAVPPGFGAASFSALAANQSAMHTLASSLARARADDAGFDPASLRMDGRVVVPPPSVSNRDLDAESEPFIVGSLRSSSRRMSVQHPSSTSVQSRQAAETADSASGQIAGSISGSARHQRPSSGNRISDMSKEDADTEVRLSGLLAPNAPSHRSLWSPKEAKARRAGKYKYKLNDEDNLKWDLWKRKVGSGDTSDIGQNAEDAKDKEKSRSTPMAVAPPTQYIAAGSGIGPRPLREATMIDPDYSTSTTNAFSAFDRHSAARTAAAIPVASIGGVEIGNRTWGYGSFKDDTSGFETEPKTSLPYKEKMMVPSLRKALRKSIFEPEPQKKLATIPDAEDAPASVSVSAGAGAGASASAQPMVREAAAPVKEADMKGALPGSVITRGFHMPGSAAAAPSAGSETPKSALAPAATTSSVPARDTGLGPPSITTFNKPTVTRSSEHATRDASVGPSLPNSDTATPTSIGRRSPRPPYVTPPPPTSATTVLESDPAQAPKPLEVFKVPADPSFQLYEEGEEPETDEGWAKVLKFMHVVEQLKTNKRTGWLHHRVPAPESIADHMYRMAILSLLCPAEADVDLGKCVQLAVVHDLAEAEVGDLTPLDGVNKHEKMRREKEAIQYFVHDLLGSSAAGLRIEALWEEYEARESKESKLVKDLDRFELGLQAMEYEKRWGIDDLQGFWEGSVLHISHPRIRRWAEELVKEREGLWRSRGREEYVQALPAREEDV